jgi:NADH-quinone oxidoreductase subunit N
MSFLPSDLDIKLSFPFIAVFAFALALAALAPAFNNRRSTAPALISILGALTTAAFSASLWNSGQFAFNGAIIADNYSLLSHLLLIVSFCAAAAHSSRSALPPAFHAWMTVALAGLMLVASAGNLLVLIAGAEIASAALLFAAGARNNSLSRPEKRPRADATLSAAASALMLAGALIVHYSTGETGLYEIKFYLMLNAAAPDIKESAGWFANPVAGADLGNSFLLTGFALFALGFIYKMSPVARALFVRKDFESIPGSLAGFMSGAAKTAFAVAAFRALHIVMPAIEEHWRAGLSAAIAASAAFSIAAAAAANGKRRRTLACMGAAHAALALSSALIGGPTGNAVMFLYLAAHAIGVAGAFALPAKGAAKSQASAIASIAILFSLASIPPSAGHAAASKLTHFAPGSFGLFITAALLAMGLIYIRILYIYIYGSSEAQRDTPDENTQTAGGSASTAMACAIAAAALGLLQSGAIELFIAASLYFGG